MPKLGLGLSLPQTRSASAPLIPASGLSLWLKADAGVTTTSYTYKSNITLSGAGESSINGSYTASDPGNSSNNYVMSGPNNNRIQVRPSSTPRYRVYNLDNSTGSTPWFYPFTSSNGEAWTAVGKKPVSITLSGLTGVSSASNGTYNSFEWVPENGSFISYKSIVGGVDENIAVEIYPSGEAAAYIISPVFFVSASKASGWGIGAWDLVEGTGSPVGTGTLYPTGGVPTGVVTTTTVNTDNVTVWADQSGNGNNATAPSGYEPTASTINEYTSIRFNTPGSYDEIYNMLQIAGAPFDQIVSFTSFLVATNENADAYANGSVFGLFGGDVQRKLQLTSGYMLLNGGDYFGGVNPNIGENVYGNVPLTLFGVRPDINNGTAKTVTAFKQNWNRDDGATIIEVDAGRYDYTGELSRGPLASFTEATEGDAYIGSASGGTENLRGDICEIIIYNRALTDQEFENVITYLNNKYAIY